MLFKKQDDHKREQAKLYAKETLPGFANTGQKFEVKAPIAPKVTHKQLTGAKFGPVRSLNTAQHSNGIDYNPSRCKDFHESGYCAFGDSCIFIHDRGDYKSGYELDREWDKKMQAKEERRKRRATKIQNGEELESDDNSTGEEELEDYDEEMVYKEIDEQCLICGQNYKFPTLLTCGHIFCDRCAIEHYKTNRTCFKCGKITDGIFNDGTKLLKKAMEERAQFKSRVKVKKNKFGTASSYLMGIDYGRGARDKF